MDDIQLKRQVLAEHLKALRKVLVVCAIAVIAAFLVMFYFFREPLVMFILKPLHQREIEVIATQVSEALIMQFKACLVAGAVLAMPVITLMIWSFVAPALYEDEKKLFSFLFVVALLLFACGVVFSYVYVFPLAIDLFFQAGEGVATTMWSIDKYFGFVLSFVLPFGLMFEMPVAIYMMARRGWVNYEKLKKSRKYVLLTIFIVAAILTPPDIVSQCMLGIPMMLLYEVGIQVSRIAKPKKARI